MQKNIASLKAVALAAAVFCATPQGVHAASNEDIVKKHFASLVSAKEPKLAELSMFFTMMPRAAICTTTIPARSTPSSVWSGWTKRATVSTRPAS